jgi:hypothetical protein
MRSIALAALALFASFGAMAAEPTYPPGSRIGLTPPKDMVLSKRFSGFENISSGFTITIAEMPAEAYAQLSSGLTEEQLKRQGFMVQSREAVKLGSRTGFLISGMQASGKVQFRKWVLGVSDPSVTALIVAQGSGYGEDEMQASLRSVAVRPALPIADQLAALPFRIGDMAGLRPVRVLSGNTLMITDGPADISKVIDQPLLVIANSFTPPPPPGEAREQFARAALASNRTIRNPQVERSQGFRQNGQDWHEIVARAVDGPSGEPIVVMQTIRFGTATYLRAVGIARADKRDAYLPRFRTVIDSVATE